MLTIVHGVFAFFLIIGVSALLVLSIARIIEAVNKAYNRAAVGHFLLLLVGLAVLFVAFPYGSLKLSLFLTAWLVLIQIPSAILLMTHFEIRARVSMRKREEALVGRFTELIEKDGGNLSAHLGLARIYERYKRYLKAADQYRVMAQMLPERSFGYASRLARKERLMRRRLAIEGASKTILCPRCQSRNKRQRRLCSQCDTPLYRNVAEWIWRGMSAPLKIGAGVTIFVSLAYLCCLPATYCMALLVVWLMVILYSSLLTGVVFSD